MTKNTASALILIISTGCTYVTIVEPGRDAEGPADAATPPLDASQTDMDGFVGDDLDAGTDAASYEIDGAGLDSGSDDAEVDDIDDAGISGGLTCRELGCGVGYVCGGVLRPMCYPICSRDGGPPCPEGTTCVAQAYSKPSEGVCIERQ